MIVEPEARHLSHLDGAFKYEDRYVLWEEEHRNLAMAAKLQRMKLLGIPFDQASTLTTPDHLRRDHVFPNAKIRRALAKHLAKGKSIDSKAFWRQWSARGTGGKSADAKLLARKEARTITAARRNIPEYIRRFEREQDQAEIDVGASTVLAQNLYLQQRIETEQKKKSLLTVQQQESAKSLLGMMASRNRLALKRMYLSTRNQWEGLMIERALERKYLEIYNTIGSDFINSKGLLKLEQEVMEVIRDYDDRFQETDWEMDALNLRDLRLRQEDEKYEYVDKYIEKMEELMGQNGELPDDYNENAGGRNWIQQIVDWEDDRESIEQRKEEQEQQLKEAEELDRELDTWNEFFDVQVAEELGRMIDAKELINEDSVTDGAIALAEKRVSKRLNATRQEWKAWKLRPQYTQVEDMYAPPADPSKFVADDAVADERKSKGQQIVERVLKSDPIMQASAKWKARMAPTFAEVDQAERDKVPGALLSNLGPDGKFVHTIGAGGTAEGSASSEAAGGVDGVAGEHISTVGHKVLNMDDPAGRRAALDHAKTNLGSMVAEDIRGMVEDPLISLLNDHTTRDGRSTKRDGAGGESASDRNAYSTVNPRLGFPDDDFRLYDPVLTKTIDKSEKKDDDANVSIMGSIKERARKLKRENFNILEDVFDDPAMYLKKVDQEHRMQNFLDLDPFGPPNTDERRDFDDKYMHLDEEDYAYKKRIDPETDYEKPLTQQWRTEEFGEPFLLKYDLHDETTELLYLLHRSDPIKWTPRALAHKFKLTAQRVKGQLIMQAIHHRMVAAGIVHPGMMEYNEEKALEDLITPKFHWTFEPADHEYQFLPGQCGTPAIAFALISTHPLPALVRAMNN